MKLLINDKEVVAFLVDLITSKVKFYDFPEPTWPTITENAERLKIAYDKNKRWNKNFNKEEEIDKIKRKVLKYLNADMKEYEILSIEIIRQRKEKLFKNIHKHIDYIFNSLGEETIFKLYKKYKIENFIKTVGFQIDKKATFVRRSKIIDFESDCLLRNTVNNERILVDKISHNYPFWFIDSGYTNFLETNKKWHRLVRNHIHNFKYFDAPVDRLGVFSKFPEQWRTSGHIILIIEPGPLSAGIFKINVPEWKYNIEKELREHTDKKIVFREKFPKKVRKSLYRELKNDDYYCVININSNAATEALWNGIPVITLDKHVTNFVTADKISDINNLRRPNLANWLCMLSYSQFTFDELMNGTALKLVKKYHE